MIPESCGCKLPSWVLVCVFSERMGKIKQKTIACLLRCPWLWYLSSLHSLDEEFRYVLQPVLNGVVWWRLSQGKPELLQARASFAISFECTLEVAVWSLHLLQGAEASPRSSLKLWLTSCREHEKCSWAMNSGFLVLQPIKGFHGNNDVSNSHLSTGWGRSTKHLRWNVTDSLPKDLSNASVTALPVIANVLAPVQP